MVPYSLYDVLRALVTRVQWQDEGERELAIASINEAEQIGVLSRIGDFVICKHPTVDEITGKCDDCTKQVDHPKRYKNN